MPAPRILKKSRRAKFELMYWSSTEFVSLRLGNESLLECTHRPILLHHLGRVANCIDDARVRAASADVALQGLDDFRWTGIRIRPQQADAAHDHAGSAIRALKSTGIEKGLLYGIQPAVFFEAFNSSNGFCHGRADGNLARAARCPTDQNGAGTALSFAATVLAACQAKFIAQDVQERRVRGVVHRVSSCRSLRAQSLWP